MRCGLGRAVGRRPRRKKNDVVVEISGEIWRTDRLLCHDELDSVAPGQRTRATEVREQHGEKTTPPGSGGTQQLRRYTRSTSALAARTGWLASSDVKPHLSLIHISEPTRPY